MSKNISDFTQMTIKENLEFLNKLEDPTAKYIMILSKAVRSTRIYWIKLFNA